MPEVNRGARPLSPFMIGPYYRPQLTSISSILVRITGIITLGTTFLLVVWLFAAASSDSAFGLVDAAFQSVLGIVVLSIAVWAAFYHMLGRLRHVVWDFGYALNVETSERMAIGMFAGATVLTVITLFAVLLA
ncbi:MAG: succinate dehydrogenase, cytochrome b556 subunit [Pseudomonadota bacterium]